MRCKHILVEMAWLTGIFIGSYLLILTITPDDKSGIDINLHDTYYIIPVAAAAISAFILLTGLVYFIKEFVYKFKRPGQKWIGYISLSLSCIMLIVFSFICGGFIEGIQNIYLADGIRSPLVPSSFADSLINDAFKMFVLAAVRTVYIILLVIMILKSRKQSLSNLSRDPF